jgi:hypothetical protein
MSFPQPRLHPISRRQQASVSGKPDATPSDPCGVQRIPVKGSRSLAAIMALREANVAKRLKMTAIDCHPTGRDKINPRTRLPLRSDTGIVGVIGARRQHQWAPASDD